MDSAVASRSRHGRLNRATGDPFDLVVVGGGIHGVCVGALAAQAGLSVLLLEQRDYAHATSSRSSKMAHGGLRYLEMFDFQQVFEGIKSREELFESCPNLVTPERFLIPIARHDWWLRCKLRVGLFLYDRLVRKKERKHRWIARKSLAYKAFNPNRSDLAGCYQYTDGLMSDARLVFEVLAAGESHGLCALNYARVEEIAQHDDGMTITWRDMLRGESHTSSTQLVVNCAGPWAPFLREKNAPVESAPVVKYSRGSHLVFSVPWTDPSLFLPLAEKGRYYFVWPHPSGTMVGTTEREVEQLQADPLPTPDEIREILERLARDLPGSGLTRENMCYAFAGIRTLPLRNSSKGVSTLSRKHQWSFERGVLTLLGGKYTTFAWTAAEGLHKALERLGKQHIGTPSLLSTLPSAVQESEQVSLLQQLGSRHGYAGPGVIRAVRRLGKQVLGYVSQPELWQEVAPGVLRLEIVHAIECEQAETIEDVLRRRVELEATPSHGKEALGITKSELARKFSLEELQVQEAAWLEHLHAVGELIR